MKDLMPEASHPTPPKAGRDPYHHIDPGFINLRKCLSAFDGALVMTRFDQDRAASSDPMTALRNNHLIVDLVLAACRHTQVPSLGEVLRNPRVGDTFCSTEDLAGTKDVYSSLRVRNRVILPYQERPRVFLEFGTAHIQNDTGKAEQSARHKVAIVGQVRKIGSSEILLAPLIMGAPSLVHPRNEDIGVPMHELAFFGFEYFQTLPEDIEEFARMKLVEVQSADEWTESMRRTSEDQVKAAFVELLKDTKQADWGGEESDHFTSSVHLDARSVTAAFVLKGPAGGSKFKPMTPSMLGKNGDQICRLAKTPARLLVVQHCHEIGPSVRDTLRHFAVTPHNPRRYCLIDGKDTYRILRAYGKL